MTRTGTDILTAISVAIFVLLTWAFADHQVTDIWNEEGGEWGVAQSRLPVK